MSEDHVKDDGGSVNHPHHSEWALTRLQEKMLRNLGYDPIAIKAFTADDYCRIESEVNDERKWAETLVNQRFNFLLVFFTIVMIGALTAGNRRELYAILILGCVISFLLYLTIARIYRKQQKTFGILSGDHVSKRIDANAPVWFWNWKRRDSDEENHELQDDMPLGREQCEQPDRKRGIGSTVVLIGHIIPLGITLVLAVFILLHIVGFEIFKLNDSKHASLRGQHATTSEGHSHSEIRLPRGTMIWISDQASNESIFALGGTLTPSKAGSTTLPTQPEKEAQGHEKAH